MKNLMFGLALGTMLLALGCAHSVAVNHDYDTSASFAHLRRYRWMSEPGPLLTGFTDARMRNAVDEQLQAKGFRPTGMPDFLVRYHVASRDRVDVRQYGYGRIGRSQVTVSEHTEGTLILDVIDSRSMRLIWRGTASGRLDGGSSTREREEQLRAGVAEMLKSFPPERG